MERLQILIPIVFLGPLLFMLLARSAARFSALLIRSLWTAWLHYLVYPRIFPEHRLLNPTRWEVALYLGHWAATAFFNTYGIRSLLQAASRAGMIALVHLVPLLASSSLDLGAHALGLSFQTFRRIHGAFGLMAAAQTLFHSIVMGCRTDLLGSQRITSLTAASAVGCLISTPLARHFAYEFFLRGHEISSIVLAVMLWLHIRTIERVAEILLITALGCFIASLMYATTSLLYRNWSYRNGLTSIVQAKQLGSSLMLKLRLSRTCRVEPGQYVHLTLITTKAASFLQRHPFTIAWWEASNSNDSDREVQRAEFIYLLIESRHGWTRSIVAHQMALENLRAFITGPYGCNENTRDCGTVLLIASGPGVFAVLPIIKRSMELIRLSATSTRWIKLVWYTDAYYDHVKPWMDMMLKEDVDKRILSISIHSCKSVSDHLEDGIDIDNSATVTRWGQRLCIIKDVPDVDGYLDAVLQRKAQDVAVAVSAFADLRRLVQKAVSRVSRAGRVRLMELEYQPTAPLPLHGGSVA